LSDLVLDASVVLAWCFPDEAEAYAESVMSDLQDRRNVAVVPTSWVFEVANGIALAERRGRIPSAEIARIINIISAVTIRFGGDFDVSHSITAVVSLSRRTKLSAYDAAYLELALRLGLPLATVDRALRRSAGDHGVGMYAPSDR
jgi:predicted nucleic acid-binding protein